MATNIFIGDLPLSVSISDNDTLIGCVNGTAKGIKYSTLVDSINTEIGSWESLGGKPFDTIDTDYLQVNTETVDDVAVRSLSFSSDFLAEITGIHGDITDIKSYISYSSSASPQRNKDLYSLGMTLVSMLGLKQSYSSQYDSYSYSPDSTVYPTLLLNLINDVMLAIGYMVSFDSNVHAWKYIRNGSPETVHNVYSAITQTLASAVGYTYSTSGGDLTLSPDGSPYLNSDMSGWLFTICSNIWNVVPTYNSSTQRWTFSVDNTNFRNKPYVQEIRKNIFDNAWTSEAYYNAGSIAVYNGEIYQCLTDNHDTTFTPANWQKLAPTKSEFDALELRVAALENNT